MFALVAIVLFVLAAFGVKFAAVNIVLIACACVAAHLLFGSVVSIPIVRRTGRD